MYLYAIIIITTKTSIMKVIYYLESEIVFKKYLDVSDVERKGDYITQDLITYKVRYRVFDRDEDIIKVVMKLA